ncbi:hypothetical protein ABW20_dc0105773 [Dactylellina cionopaga]|nr:hypothetical protein ABW20_dc0105773 [Dactylellina cionopaga]
MYQELKEQNWSTYKIAEKLGMTDQGVTISNWAKNENKILMLKVGQRSSSSGRSALLPEIEDALYERFKNLRLKGIKVKRSWFIATGRKLFQDLYPQGTLQLLQTMETSNSHGSGLMLSSVPLESEFLAGKTYETIGTKSVWLRSKGSGLDKRQATVQLCIFADGVPRIKPALVFKGTGQRIVQSEKDKWDKRVTVNFQKKA